MADQTTPGLDSVGNEPLIQGKPAAAPKQARYALPVTPSTGVLPGSILEDMERIYQKRLAAQSPFQDWIKDVLAWGGTDRPNTTLETLRERAKEKEDRAAELFRMRSDIASARAQQEQLARQSEFLRSLSGPGAPPAAGGLPSGTPAQAGRIPEMVTRAINEKVRMGDVAGAQKIYDEYNKGLITEETKFLANPSSYQRNIEIVTDDGRVELVDAITARRLFQEGKAQPLTPTAAAPSPTRPVAAPTPAPAPAAMTTAAAPAPAPAVTPTSAAPAPAVTPTAAAPAPAPVEVTEPTADKFRFENLTEPQIAALEKQMIDMGVEPRDTLRRADVAERFNSYPLNIRQRAFAAANEGMVPAAGQAPEAPKPPTQVAQAPAEPPKKRPTLPEAKAQLEIEKQLAINAAQEALKTDSKRRETFEKNTDAMTVSERLNRAKRAQQLVLSDPTIAGVISGPGYKNAISVLLQQGISTPSGSVSLQGLSEAIYKTLPTTMDTKKRYELAGILANMELDASAVMNGQGQISDGERKILSKASISIEDPAEVVYKKAKMMQARQETLQKLAEVYGDGIRFRTSFKAFENDPQYKRIAAEYEKQLDAIAAEDIKIPRVSAAQPKQPKSGTAPGGVKWKVVPQ
jgi:hypothetical protein